MEPGDFGEIIQRQRQATLRAQNRKGQVATNKPDRWSLEILFARKGRPNDGHHVRTHFFSFAYPPSTTPMTKLEAITISDLRLETHHRGRVLIVRTFGHPVRIAGVQNAVEDVNGNVDRLAIYNEAETSAPEQILPKAAVFAVKEPFYKATADGGYNIRVDHPSDLVHLQPSDAQCPAAWHSDTPISIKSAMEYKNEGNAAYRAKDYLLAVESYTHGLAVVEEGSPMIHDLLRNRSMVNLLLNRFESAEADARAAVITQPVSSDHKQLDSKSWYRAGRAAYELGKYDSAQHAFRSALALTPDDEDVDREIKRCLQRLRETLCGDYSFSGIAARHSQLDSASFISNTSVGNSGTRGRGLFAAKDIKAGELVLCEKAFRVASRGGNDTYTLINLNTNRGAMGPHASLLFAIVQKLRNNPAQASLFLDLYDGGYKPKCTAEIVDGATVIDTFQVQAIIEHNCFGCGDSLSTTTRNTSSGTEDDPSESVGMWITASFINHACAGNASRCFIGDMMMVRATCDIARGEEITMPYRAPNADFAALRKRLKDTWGFDCDCTICAAEKATPASQRAEREKLVKESLLLMSNHKLSRQYQPNRATVDEAARLYQKLERTYGPNFHGVPRIGLVSLGVWLCQVYSLTSLTSKTLNVAGKTLHAAGFNVKVVGGQLSVTRERCVMLDNSTVDAAVYAAHSHFSLNEVAIGKQYESLAQELHRTISGDGRGFEKRYGSSANVY